MNTFFQFFADLFKKMFSSKKVLHKPQVDEDYEAWLGV